MKNAFPNYNNTEATVIGQNIETLPLVQNNGMLNLHGTIQKWSDMKKLNMSVVEIDEVVNHFYMQTEEAVGLLAHIQTMAQLSDGKPTAFDTGLLKLQNQFPNLTAEKRFYSFAAFVLCLRLAHQQ